MSYEDDSAAAAPSGGAGAPSKPVSHCHACARSRSRDASIWLCTQIPDSKLEPRVRSLIELICDVKMMEEQMKEIGFDARKMPLGKLSSRIIRDGYQVPMIAVSIPVVSVSRCAAIAGAHRAV